LGEDLSKDRLPVSTVLLIDDFSVESALSEAKICIDNLY
jgi:hypothetical protein